LSPFEPVCRISVGDFPEKWAGSEPAGHLGMEPRLYFFYGLLQTVFPANALSQPLRL